MPYSTDKALVLVYLNLYRQEFFYFVPVRVHRFVFLHAVWYEHQHNIFFQASDCYHLEKLEKKIGLAVNRNK